MEILEFINLTTEESNSILAKMNDNKIFQKFRYKINLNGYVIFARLVAARHVAGRGNLLTVGLKTTETGARRAGNLISWGNA